jgi:hypothetical protein
MFGFNLFADADFASSNTSGRIAEWVNQCAAVNNWFIAPAEASGFANQVVVSTSWSASKDIRTVKLC